MVYMRWSPARLGEAQAQRSFLALERYVTGGVFHRLGVTAAFAGNGRK